VAEDAFDERLTLLALAAYSNQTDKEAISEKSLTDEGLAKRQADWMIRNQELALETFRDTDTGFDVTVYEYKQGVDAGKLTVAIRGTKGLTDLVEDWYLLTKGAAFHQIVSLYNWWQRESNAEGCYVEQYSITSVAEGGPPPVGGTYIYTALGQTLPPGVIPLKRDYYLVNAPQVAATGDLHGALANQPQVDVTGHSLGGHLTIAFDTLFHGQVRQAMTVNAPGFMSTPEITAFFKALGAGAAPNDSDMSHVTSLVADEAEVGRPPWVLIAGLHSRLGQKIDLSIEDQTRLPWGEGDTVRNHSMKAMSDASAIYGDVLQKLSESIDPATYKSLRGSSSAQEAESYERLVDSLEYVLTGNTQRLPVGNTRRDELHAAIGQAASSGAMAALDGQTSLTLNFDSDRAKTDFAAFLSLPWGMTFQLWQKGGDPNALTSVHAELYAAWSKDKQLRSEQADPLALSFTDRWMAERASWLYWRGVMNQKDVNTFDPKVYADFHRFDDRSEGRVTVVGPLGAYAPVRYTTFGSNLQDAAAGGDLQDALFGGGGADTLDGAGGQDWLEGGGGVDLLKGGAGNDILLGGEGGDNLFGGAGVNLLRGGLGSDYYFVMKGDGTQVVSDTDNNGTLVLEGMTLPVGVWQADGLWRSADRSVTFAKVPVAADRWDLVVSFSGSSPLAGSVVVIEQGQSGGFGLRLQDAKATEPPLTKYRGDQRAPISNETYQWSECWWDLATGELVHGVPQPGFHDVIEGTAQPEDMDGREGNDALDGGSGADSLTGGLGNDWLSGGRGSDTLRGGDGNDVLMSAHSTAIARQQKTTDSFVPPFGELVWIAGDTWGVTKTPFGQMAEADAALSGVISANGLGVQAAGVSAKYYWLDATYVADTLSNLLDGGEGDDDLYGGEGADILLGGGGNEFIMMGRGGDDTLDGGTGDDQLWGDGIDDADPGSLVGAPAAQHGVDLLVGGTGNDLLVGGGKGDLLYGGVGNDALSGDDWVGQLAATYHGADRLEGGVGLDTLVGGGAGDLLDGGDNDDSLYGDDGAIRNPVLSFDAQYHGDDQLRGGLGNDRLWGEGGSDLLWGGAGNDLIWGDTSAQVMTEGHGSDWLEGGDGDDALFGGGGADTLWGGAGADWLAGEDETVWDAVSTLFGYDELHGGEGDDTLVGGRGNDLLDGGEGIDHMFGSPGNDIYVITEESAANIARQGQAPSRRPVLANGDADLPAESASRADARVAVDWEYMADTGGDDLIRCPAAVTVQDDLLDTSLTLGIGAAGQKLEIFYAYRKPGLQLEMGGETVLVRDWVQDKVSTSFRFSTDASFSHALYGAGGNDVLYGSSRDADGKPINDTLDGGWGNDVLSGSNGDDVLIGDRGDDSLYGYDDNDLLLGGQGSDTLSSGTGNDTLDGGEGDDLLTLWTGQSTVTGGSGNDRIDVSGAGFAQGIVSTVLFSRGDGADELVGSSAAAPDVTLQFGPGISASQLRFERDSDWHVKDLKIRIADTDDSVLIRDFSALDDPRSPANPLRRIRFDDGTELSLDAIIQRLNQGTDGDDFMRGFSGAESLTGGLGNDELQSNDHLDTLVGGAGDDVLSGGLVELGGDGRDICYGGLEGARLEGGTSDDLLDGYSAARQWLDGGDGADTLKSTGQGVTLVGGAGDDTLQAWDLEAKGQVLVPGAGNDLMECAAGATVLFGRGDGVDVFSGLVDQSNRGLPSSTAVLGTGIARADMKLGLSSRGGLIVDFGQGDSLELRSFFSNHTSPDVKVYTVETLRFVDGSQLQLRDLMHWSGSGNDSMVGSVADDVYASGSGNDTLRGGSGNDILLGEDNSDQLFGDAGNDTLVGGSGSDTLTGGLGDDVYHANWEDAAAVELAGQGSDTVVYVGTTYVLPTNVEHLVSAGSAFDGNRFFTGNASDNRLDMVNEDRACNIAGLAGRDSLLGGAGGDTLDGGIGDDVLRGGAGNDTYVFEAGGGVDVIDNTDLHFESATDVLLLRNLRLQDIDLFRQGDDVLVRIKGRADEVRLSNYFQDDGDAGLAVDLLRCTDGDLTVAQVKAALLAKFGSGNDTVIGYSGSDLILGAAGRDRLEGRGDADTLDGGLGADTLVGGDGDDIYEVDDVGDLVIEATGAEGGLDRIRSSLQSAVLFAGVEQLELVGVLASQATGNSEANALFGNSAANRLEAGGGDDLLDGRSGADTLIGGTGNDVYVAEASDEVVELIGEGVDRLDTWLGLGRSLSAQVENLRLLGDTDIDGAGNNLNNLLEGNAGANRLVGLLGRDTLRGYAGDDTLTGGSGDDRYVIDAGGGSDLIVESSGQSGGVDTLQFVNSGRDDVLVERSGQHLVVLATSSDGLPVQLLLKDWYATDQRPIEWVEWSDGSTSGAADLDALAVAQGASDLADSAAVDQWLAESRQETPAWLQSLIDDDQEPSVNLHWPWWERRDGWPRRVGDLMP